MQNSQLNRRAVLQSTVLDVKALEGAIRSSDLPLDRLDTRRANVFTNGRPGHGRGGGYGGENGKVDKHGIGMWLRVKIDDEARSGLKMLTTEATVPSLYAFLPGLVHETCTVSTKDAYCTRHALPL